MPVDYPYIWRVRTRLPDRKGQRCRVLKRGKMNSCLVEFEDGYRVITSRNYLRKQPPACGERRREMAKCIDCDHLVVCTHTTRDYSGQDCPHYATLRTELDEARAKLALVESADATLHLMAEKCKTCAKVRIGNDHDWQTGSEGWMAWCPSTCPNIGRTALIVGFWVCSS